MSIVLFNPSFISTDSFTVKWNESSTVDSYIINVATDLDFTSKVSGYDNKKITIDSESVTGLSDRNAYYFKVDSYLLDDTGTAESGTVSNLTDTNKAWVVDEYVGAFVHIIGGTGVDQISVITANTSTTITADFGISPDATSVYEIITLVSNSDVKDLITGFNAKCISVEFANIAVSLSNVTRMSIEVSTDFNLNIKVKNTDDTYLENVDCLIIQTSWTNKGSWNPNTDPDPSTPSEGDFYTIEAGGVNDITGEDIDFTTLDLLLYENSVWAYKKSRNITTDASGNAFGYIDYDVDNCIQIDHAGYQMEEQCVNKIAGEHSIIVELYNVVSSVITRKGVAVNLKYKSRTSNSFN